MTSFPNHPDLDEAVLEIGARLDEKPSKRLIDHVFAEELQRQQPLFTHMGSVDLAFTIVGIETGVIPPDPGRALLAALLELQAQAERFQPLAERGDLYTNREAWLAEQTDSVGWLGAGRARREASTTAFVLLQRQRLLDLNLALAELGRSMHRRAIEHKDSLMPDYTYLQSAQPTTFGHYLLGFLFPLLRDCERLSQLYRRINHSPLGCGSTTGSTLVRDRTRMADLLGFDGPIPHTRDAMWQADLPIETVAALCACTVNMSRLAEDLLIFSTAEFGLIELSDRHARASKILPQKKNPFGLTHIRGVCNEMIGILTTAAAVGRTPSGQPDNRLWAYGALPDAVLAVHKTAELLAELIEHLTFDASRGSDLLGDGFSMATNLAEYLVREHGMDFRSAHRLLGQIARSSRETGKPINQSTFCAAVERGLGHPIKIGDDVFQRLLDPSTAIQQHAQPGSPANASMNDMLENCDQQLGAIARETERSCRQIAAVERHLSEQARTIASS